MKRTVMLPRMYRSASIAPTTLSEKDRTVELVWSTGSRVERYSFWDGPFYEELLVDESAVNMERLASGAPLLVTHENHPDSVIGVVERAWIENGEGRAIVRFGSDEDSDKYFRKVKDGILRNVSVGYNVDTFRDITTKDDKYPVKQAIYWTPAEISLVGVGADPGAGTRAASNELSPCTIEEKDMPKNQKAAPAQSQRAGSEPEVTPQPESTTPAPEQTAQTEPATPATPESPAAVVSAPADVEAARAEGARAERSRANEIERAVRAANLDQTFARSLIDGGQSIADAQAAIFKELEKRSMQINPAASIQAGTQDERQTRREGAADAILHRINPRAFEMTEKGKRFHGMSLVRISEEFVGGGSAAAIAMRAMSDSDLPIIMGDVVNRQMLRELKVQPRLFMDFVSVGKLTNFHAKKRPQLNDVSDLDEVDPDSGELKTGVINEGGEEVKLGFFGKKFIFTYKMLVNDDMEILTKVPGLSIRSAIRLENKTVFGVLTSTHKMRDGKTLFHNDHANLVSSGSAMSEATLDELVQKIAAQKTSDSGDFLGLNPNILIHGPKWTVRAKKLTATGVVPGSADDVSAYAGILKPIGTPWISDYAFIVGCSPDQGDGIEVQYLEGQEDPVLTSERDFNTSGLKFKIEHHFGVKALDHRLFAKNNGAAPV